MLKIAFIATNEWAPWGGSELCWSLAAEKLVQCGVQVNVSVKMWDSPVKQVEDLRSLGCRVFFRQKPSLLDRIGRRLSLRREYILNHLKTIGAGADLIVVSQGNNMDGLPWMEAARALGLKYAVVSQSAAECWWPEDGTGERLAECHEAACATYFVSEGNLALSQRQFGTMLSRARVIRNPFNVRYNAKPAWPGDSSEQLSLACVGRLDARQKGQDLLLQVLSLPRWRGRNVRVTLVGDGMHERSLRRMIEMFKLSNVEFAGFVDDIEEIWSKHHALVLPSRYEGMPLALVEAMICGRACIVTDVAGHRELVRDDVNGFLAKAPTVGMLDEAMNRAWENRMSLKEMGEAAAADVRKFVPADPVEGLVQDLQALSDGASASAS